MKIHSIRTKFILIFSLLIVSILLVNGYVVIEQKKKEIHSEIAYRGLSFAELSVGNVVDNYNLLYKSQSFSFFKREIENILKLNSDISGVRVVTYNGDILYNSEEEKDIQYTGEPREVDNPGLIERLQDVKPSMLLEDRVVYFEKDDLTGKISYMDKNENPVTPLGETEKVIGILYPYPDDQTRVIYSVTYDNLEKRIQETTNQIILILIITCIIGVFLAILIANRIVNPIKELTKGVEEIARGNLGYKVTVHTNDEMKILANGFNQMAADLEVSTKAVIEQEKITNELAIAGKIQRNLLPKIPNIPGIDIAASVLPAEAVGGDCYDFLTLDEDNTLIYIGDVTGHGVPASLIVAITNAIFYNMLDFYNDTRNLIIQANKVLKAKTEPNMFVTAVLCNWNHKEHKLTYTSAGHEQILHYKSASKEMNLCEAGGMALGMLPDIQNIVHEKTIDLQNQDVIILYSDGIPEAWKNKNELLGMERFKEIAERACREYTDAKNIHDSILKEVAEFMGEYPQADDITLIIIKSQKEHLERKIIPSQTDNT